MNLRLGFDRMDKGRDRELIAGDMKRVSQLTDEVVCPGRSSRVLSISVAKYVSSSTRKKGRDANRIGSETLAP